MRNYNERSIESVKSDKLGTNQSCQTQSLMNSRKIKTMTSFEYKKKYTESGVKNRVINSAKKNISKSPEPLKKHFKKAARAEIQAAKNLEKKFAKKEPKKLLSPTKGMVGKKGHKTTAKSSGNLGGMIGRGVAHAPETVKVNRADIAEACATMIQNAWIRYSKTRKAGYRGGKLSRELICTESSTIKSAEIWEPKAQIKIENFATIDPKIFNNVKVGQTLNSNQKPKRPSRYSSPSPVPVQIQKIEIRKSSRELPVDESDYLSPNEDSVVKIQEIDAQNLFYERKSILENIVGDNEIMLTTEQFQNLQRDQSPLRAPFKRAQRSVRTSNGHQNENDEIIRSLELMAFTSISKWQNVINNIKDIRSREKWGEVNLEDMIENLKIEELVSNAEINKDLFSGTSQAIQNYINNDIDRRGHEEESEDDGKLVIESDSMGKALNGEEGESFNFVKELVAVRQGKSEAFEDGKGFIGNVDLLGSGGGKGKPFCGGLDKISPIAAGGLHQKPNYFEGAKLEVRSKTPPGFYASVGKGEGLISDGFKPRREVESASKAMMMGKGLTLDTGAGSLHKLGTIDMKAKVPTNGTNNNTRKPTLPLRSGLGEPIITITDGDKPIPQNPALKPLDDYNLNGSIVNFDLDPESPSKDLSQSQSLTVPSYSQNFDKKDALTSHDNSYRFN